MLTPLLHPVALRLEPVVARCRRRLCIVGFPLRFTAADKEIMSWDHARRRCMPGLGLSREMVSGSGARHRAPEPDVIDQLSDTVMIRLGCFTYGRHAAEPLQSADTGVAVGLCLQPAAMLARQVHGRPRLSPAWGGAAAGTIPGTPSPSPPAVTTAMESSDSAAAPPSTTITRVALRVWLRAQDRERRLAAIHARGSARTSRTGGPRHHR